MIVLIEGSIEGSIERIASDPLDLADIAKFWKVYTTTKRRLLDPTAERLENYWWRIWGSRKKELDSTTVARLFAQISNGETFVPLREPATRDEGGSRLEINARFAIGASSTTALYRPRPNRQNTASSRPPTAMPPPILKKSRGPSSTGPRPTARFISPHGSEAESQSSIGSNSHVVVQPPSPEGETTKAERKSSMPGRKKSGFVASSAGKKKRPVIVRRGTSQASFSTLETGRILESPHQKTPPTVAGPSQARAKQPTPSKFQENFSPVFRIPAVSSPIDQVMPDNPESQKQSVRKSTDGKQKEPLPRSSSSEKQASSKRKEQSPVPSLSEKQPSNKQLTNATSNDAKQSEPSQTIATSFQKPSASASVSVENSRTQVVHKSLRSRSDGEHLYNHNESMPAIRTITEAKGLASLAPTYTDVAGQMALGDTPMEISGNSRQPPSAADKGKGTATGDIFSKRPVQPARIPSSSAPAGSLARSKSQLTLLLEKDKARCEEHKKR